ncbi:MAG: hypothetical protein KF726_13425 [Anaerolineae bacterium]|nr:hypothetical protein [Anaerolineae bacterium]
MTFDDHVIGHVDSVVIDPCTKEVSHLIVRQGIFFTHDKLIPIALVASATDESILLKNKSTELPDLVPFEEKHFVAYDERHPEAPNRNLEAQYAEQYLWNPPVSTVSSLNYGLAPYEPYYAYPTQSVGKPEIVHNIPDAAVVLKEGAHVFGANGHRLGHVIEIFTDSTSGRVTHLLVSHGLLLTVRKLIPFWWVCDVCEDEIHLSVDNQMLERLPDYVND